MRNPLVVVLALLAAALPASAQQPTQVPVWNGSVRCEIDIKGPGYANHQTHTWTLTGAVPPDGGLLDYPGTWTVSGQGSLKPSETQTPPQVWTTKGSMPGVRLAIYVRPSDQKLLVFPRNEQLSVASGTNGDASGAVKSKGQAIELAAYEWRPFPMIEDVPTSTHIAGSSTTSFTNRLDYLQPAGSEGRASCSWDLVRMTATAGATSMLKTGTPNLPTSRVLTAASTPPLPPEQAAHTAPVNAPVVQTVPTIRFTPGADMQWMFTRFTPGGVQSSIEFENARVWGRIWLQGATIRLYVTPPQAGQYVTHLSLHCGLGGTGQTVLVTLGARPVGTSAPATVLKRWDTPLPQQEFYKFDQTVSLAAGDNILEWKVARTDCSMDDLTVEGL